MSKKEKNKPVQKRKWWFRCLKKLIKGRYKQPEFIYLGEEIGNGGLILSNHEGTDAPLSLELYLNKPIRMWGAHEMNSGLVPMYKYQTRVYYHEKKHWNLHLARLFCLIASPLTNLFYRGLNLISTYHDTRLLKTVRESMNAIEQGENIVVFPEDSTNGYLEQLEGFHNGFAVLAEVCYRKGVDLPIYVTYFNKKAKIYMVDKPVKYSELIKRGETREELSARLLARCNELGKMSMEIAEQRKEAALAQSENKEKGRKMDAP
ncbi:MAG: hypothetical protein IJ329_02165 [Clostridia bacterium]|nr:hypothetical protein [Clostridia bacterium]